MAPFCWLYCLSRIREDSLYNLEKPAPFIIRIAGFWEMAFIVWIWYTFICRKVIDGGFHSLERSDAYGQVFEI